VLYLLTWKTMGEFNSYISARTSDRTDVEGLPQVKPGDARAQILQLQTRTKKDSLLDV
jgi:hypothetical protein